MRLGEASHPGPSDLQAWSQNIRSWQASGTDWLTHASDAKVQLVFMQDRSITLHTSAFPQFRILVGVSGDKH